jgi:N-acetyl-anhydromuramyl-L-alanine amidase AmpD
MRTILILVCLFASTCFGAQLYAAPDPVLESRYQTYSAEFEAAYQQHPEIPRGILEAVAWTNTRMTNRQPETSAPSCMGLPQVSGIMGLMVDGAGWFRENGNFIAQTTRVSPAAMREVGVQVMAYAQALSDAARAQKGDLRDPATWLHAVGLLSEIPADKDPVNNYALQSQLYSVGVFLLDAEAQYACQFSAQPLDLVSFFGASNYRVLSATAVSIEGENIRSGPNTFEPLPTGVASADYGPAIWNAAASCNYSSRAGTAVSAITIHTTQGGYAGSISWFQNCASSVSAHYVIRSLDGQVTQMVLESDKAWHVGSENPYTIGIENEGFVDDAAWYSLPLYAACVDVCNDIAASGYGINKLRTFYGTPTVGTNLLSVNCYKIKGHQHYPNQTHNDPGVNWDWERFYRLLNGTPSTTVYTTASGTLYDAGGSGANYGDDQRQAWRISPTGARTVTLTFSSFNCENNYDYLHIYDGTSDKGQLIGKFTGTTLPAAVTARSGSIFLEFRSDCATNAAGWAASWTSSTTALSCGYPTSVSTTNITPFAATFSWAAAAGATGYEVRFRHSLSSTWTTVNVTGTSYTLTGLKSSAGYYWQVRTKCAGPTFSTWAGTGFETLEAANTSSNLCSGTLRDSGGDIANYRNAESYTYTIAPTGATSVTLTFSAFNLETNYDYLYLYNGPTTASPLIGTFTGTTSPGTRTATSGTMTVRFVSDNATVRSGYAATWSCVGGLSAVTAAAEPAAAMDWTVAPNPFETALRLDLTAAGMHGVRILDLQGRTVYQAKLMGGTSHDLSIQTLAAGAYLLQVTSPDGIPSQRRIVHQ